MHYAASRAVVTCGRCRDAVGRLRRDDAAAQRLVMGTRQQGKSGGTLDRSWGRCGGVHVSADGRAERKLELRADGARHERLVVPARPA